MTVEQSRRWIADVPVSCVCEHVWRGGRWVRSVPHPGCPWPEHAATAVRA